MRSLRLEVLPGRFAICRLPPAAASPTWASGSLVSITRTPEELSVVCSEAVVPVGVHQAAHRRALRVVGTLEMSLVGVLAAIAVPLAEAGVAIFALSTFDTDYLLVEEQTLAAAVAALRAAGHVIVEGAE